MKVHHGRELDVAASVSHGRLTVHVAPNKQLGETENVAPYAKDMGITVGVYSSLESKHRNYTMRGRSVSQGI